MLILVILTGCTVLQKPAALTQPWTYSSLRAISSTQISGDPTRDLTAIYTRQVGPEWQVRLDFLDLSSPPNCDLYIALDTRSGGTNTLPLDASAALQWDTLLVIPASGQIQALSSDPLDPGRIIPKPGMRIRVLRDPVMDKMEISFNRTALDAPLGFKVQVWVTAAGSKAVSDSLGPVRSDGTPPPPANVLLAFWNTLPAYTPAQALRRWDGAHTGPLGGRHGLSNLLHAARSTNTPIALLDLKLPASLAALDSVEGTKFVDKLNTLGLLILPDNLPGFASDQLPVPLPKWSLARFQSDSRQVGVAFGIPPGPFVFAPYGLSENIQPALRSTRMTFIPASPDTPELLPVQVARWGNLKALPIPGYGSPSQPVPQASLDGPTLAVRHALVQTAASENMQTNSILVLGGDLPQMAWGNPNAAIATMRYLQGHPWIHVLDGQELLATPPTDPAAGRYDPAVASVSSASDAVIAKLQRAPDNEIRTEAWQMVEALFAPAFPNPAELPALRASYLGQVNTLLEAADWAACEKDGQNPASGCPEAEKVNVDCTRDVDLDGQPECLLVSDQFFGVFETSGAYLSFAFALDPQGNAHQIIAPSSELLSGLSESSSWDLSAGANADPEVYPGAFGDLTPLGSIDTQTVYQPEIQADGIVFSSPDGKRVKTFQLSSNRLRVTYHSSDPLTTQIPLVLDPWLRFTPGWFDEYESAQDGETWSWAVRPFSQASTSSSVFAADPFQVKIDSSAVFSTQTFKDSEGILASPENPNRDNPPGHFLPFPMALVEIHSQQDFSVNLDFLSMGK